jgi:hypothetical protein
LIAVVDISIVRGKVTWNYLQPAQGDLLIGADGLDIRSRANPDMQMV